MKYVVTRSINKRLLKDAQFSKFIWNSFAKFKNQDWGDLPLEDKRMNDSAVKNGDDRIVVRYNSECGDIYIITEYDRSYTTILFTHEY